MIWQVIYDIMISTNNCNTENDRDTNHNISLCDSCDHRPADIFQVEGDNCLDCWQKLTHPNL